MRIALLSEIDYAGSGHKLYEALNRHTEHEVRIFTGKYHNPYEHPDHSSFKRKEAQAYIDECDIVHLKGDFPPREGYLGFRILHKPIVVTVSGSHFRKAYHGGHQKYHSWEYNKAKVKTAFEPDLLYPEYSDLWTPHPIDCMNINREWKISNPPILMHVPTRKEVKGSDFIAQVCNVLSKRMKIEYVQISGIPHEEAVEAKKAATIFLDQFVVGFYGNSALEAMQYGIPTAAYISEDAVKQANGALNLCPVITARKTIKDWVDKLEETLKGNLLNDSIQTKMWCDAIHSYQSVANEWNAIYKSIQLEVS